MLLHSLMVSDLVEYFDQNENVKFWKGCDGKLNLIHDVDFYALSMEYALWINANQNCVIIKAVIVSES